MGDCIDVLCKLINLQLRQVRYFRVIVRDRHDYYVFYVVRIDSGIYRVEYIVSALSS